MTKLITKYLSAFYLIFIFLIALIIIKKCDEPSEEELEIMRKNSIEEFEKNSKKFYYPKLKDGISDDYKANVIGAEGWVHTDCRNDIEGRIVIVEQYDIKYHQPSREYKGKLIAVRKGEDKTYVVKFECFIPDYKFGSWLRK